MDAVTPFFADLLVPGVPLLEKIVRPIIVYVFLVVALRLAGRRELGQLNTFDLIVLLMLSNTVQNAIIGNDNSVVGGLVGAASLLMTNWLVVRFLYRHPALERTLEGEPAVLIRDGVLLRDRLRRELITEQEVLAAIRRQGFESPGRVGLALLETSGTISVFPRAASPDQSAGELQAQLRRVEGLLEALLGTTRAPP